MSPKKVLNSPKAPEEDQYNQQKPMQYQQAGNKSKQQQNGTLSKTTADQKTTNNTIKESGNLKLDSNYNSVKEPNKVVSITEKIETQKCDNQVSLLTL